MTLNGRGRVINSTFFSNRAATAGTNIVGQGGGLIISRGTIDISHVTLQRTLPPFRAERSLPAPRHR